MFKLSRILSVTLIASITAAVCCAGEPVAPPPATEPAPARPDFLKTDKDVASYAIGQTIGMQVLDVGNVLDLDALVKALRNAAESKPSTMDDAELQKTLTAFQAFMTEKQAAESKTPPIKAPDLANKDKVSYAVGTYFGTSLKSLAADLDLNLLTQSFTASAKGEKSKLNPVDAQKTVQSYLGGIQKKMGDKNKTDGETFLAENAKKEGVKTTASGLQYKVIKDGTGPKPPSPSTEVEVHYEGRLLDGSVFDSSIKRNEPTSFGLNQVIGGWTEGVQLMPQGSKYEFYIPSGLAYGPGGNQRIPPNSTLIFTIELLKIKGGTEAKK